MGGGRGRGREGGRKGGGEGEGGRGGGREGGRKGGGGEGWKGGQETRDGYTCSLKEEGDGPPVSIIIQCRCCIATISIYLYTVHVRVSNYF